MLVLLVPIGRCCMRTLPLWEKACVRNLERVAPATRAPEAPIYVCPT